MIIALDTGNRYIKTAHAEPFSAGLNKHFDSPPIVAEDTLFYDGNYYTFSETQGFHRQDKTVDDYYFILSLAGIAREIVMKHALVESGEKISFTKAMKNAERKDMHFKEDIFLSVGLPPRDMKTQADKFKQYYMNRRSPIIFTYNNVSFEITIERVCVSPQGFAAIFPNELFKEVTRYPQAYIIDVGGYTTDIARFSNRRIDANFFESLDYGMIHLYNEVISVISKNHQKNITGVLIEAVLRGESIGDEEVEKDVLRTAETYAKKLIDALRDRNIDLSLSLPVLVGGGAQSLEKALKDAIARKEIFVIPDIKANAIGYEVMAKRLAKEQNSKK